MTQTSDQRLLAQVAEVMRRHPEDGVEYWYSEENGRPTRPKVCCYCNGRWPCDAHRQAAQFAHPR